MSFSHNLPTPALSSMKCPAARGMTGKMPVLRARYAGILSLLSLLFAASVSHAGAETAVAAQAPAPAQVQPAEAQRTELRLTPGITYSDKVLTEDTVWRGEVLVEGVVAVAPQATLRVEPGTTVRFKRSATSKGLLLVQGRIVATGAADAPILLSSTLSPAQPGDWQGVMLLGTEKKNLLENCRIEGAAAAVEALYSAVVLKGVRLEHSTTGGRFQDALVTFDGGGSTDCDLALNLRESEAELSRVGVTGNGQGIVLTGGSLYLAEGNLAGNRGTALNATGARLKIAGGTVTGNASGILLSSCEGSLSGVRLSANQEVALSLAKSRMRITGNELSRNGTGIRAEDGAAVAWGNAILENAAFDLYNAGDEEFRAPGNWWGDRPKIFDNSGRGAVLTAPLLGARPQP